MVWLQWNRTDSSHYCSLTTVTVSLEYLLSCQSRKCLRRFSACVYLGILGCRNLFCNEEQRNGSLEDSPGTVISAPLIDWRLPRQAMSCVASLLMAWFVALVVHMIMPWSPHALQILVSSESHGWTVGWSLISWERTGSWHFRIWKKTPNCHWCSCILKLHTLKHCFDGYLDLKWFKQHYEWLYVAL